MGAGATCHAGRSAARSACFNPHPPVGAGATQLRHQPLRTARQVSILTRPWGRVQPTATADAPTRSFVSILTRPWGRVQRGVGLGVGHSGVMFQSSPARGGGCNQPIAFRCQLRAEFQSSPARGGGCNTASGNCSARPSSVSILTRPWGRVQRGLENARERFPKRKCSSCQGVPCRALGG